MNYINIDRFDNSIVLSFYIEEDKIMAIGEKLEQINENAYMNGYNWEMLLNCYIEQNVPELTDTFETDSEAGMYTAIFEDSPEGEKAANLLSDTIILLIENENKLFDFVSEYGDEIEWD